MSRFHRGVVLLLVAVSRAFATDSPKPDCALVKACGLAVEMPACTKAMSAPIDGVTYDAARCAEPLDLLAHGVSPASAIGPFVYGFLGGRYRVVYDIKGEAPISEARFDFLADDLPLAAKLASRLSKTRYVMNYADGTRRRFHAERADKLTGDAEQLLHDPGEKRRVYYGWGNSKFGPWKLRGSAFVDIRVRPSGLHPKGIAYDVRIRTAPANAMINAIMRLGIFKGYVVGQIDDTMKDLVGAAAALNQATLEKVLIDPAFSVEEHARIRTLAALPQ